MSCSIPVVFPFVSVRTHLSIYDSDPIHREKAMSMGYDDKTVCNQIFTNPPYDRKNMNAEKTVINISTGKIQTEVSDMNIEIHGEKKC